MVCIYGLEKSQKTQLGLEKSGVRIVNESWTGGEAGIGLLDIPTWLDSMIVPVLKLELMQSIKE